MDRDFVHLIITLNENAKLGIKDGTKVVIPAKDYNEEQLLIHFEKEKKYTEQEVSEILKNLYDDFATLRRYFIEYGFMARSKDGLQYWLK